MVDIYRLEQYGLTLEGTLVDDDNDDSVLDLSSNTGLKMELKKPNGIVSEFTCSRDDDTIQWSDGGNSVLDQTGWYEYTFTAEFADRLVKSFQKRGFWVIE